jgi:hypothetical protein
VFASIKKSIKRYSAQFILAHIFCATMSPFLHAHSATPISSTHPEQMHVHLLTAAAEIGICSITGNQQTIFTIETSESHPSKAVKNIPPIPTILLAHPQITNTDAPASILVANQHPKDFISRIHLHGELPFCCSHPQAP